MNCKSSRYRGRCRDGDNYRYCMNFRHRGRCRDGDSYRDYANSRHRGRFRDGDSYRDYGNFRHRGRCRDGDSYRDYGNFMHRGRFRDGDSYRDYANFRHRGRCRDGDSYRYCTNFRHRGRCRDGNSYRNCANFGHLERYYLRQYLYIIVNNFHAIKYKTNKKEKISCTRIKAFVRFKFHSRLLLASWWKRLAKKKKNGQKYKLNLPVELLSCVSCSTTTPSVFNQFVAFTRHEINFTFKQHTENL